MHLTIVDSAAPLVHACQEFHLSKLSLCLSGLKLIGSFFKWQGFHIYNRHTNCGVCEKVKTIQTVFSFMRLDLIELIVQLFYLLCPEKRLELYAKH